MANATLLMYENLKKNSQALAITFQNICDT